MDGQTDRCQLFGGVILQSNNHRYRSIVQTDDINMVDDLDMQDTCTESMVTNRSITSEMEIDHIPGTLKEGTPKVYAQLSITDIRKDMWAVVHDSEPSSPPKLRGDQNSHENPWRDNKKLEL